MTNRKRILVDKLMYQEKHQSAELNHCKPFFLDCCSSTTSTCYWTFSLYFTCVSFIDLTTDRIIYNENNLVAALLETVQNNIKSGPSRHMVHVCTAHFQLSTVKYPAPVSCFTSLNIEYWPLSTSATAILQTWPPALFRSSIYFHTTTINKTCTFSQ